MFIYKKRFSICMSFADNERDRRIAELSQAIIEIDVRHSKQLLQIEKRFLMLSERLSMMSERMGN